MYRREALERIMATGIGVTTVGYTMIGARADESAGGGASKTVPPQEAVARLRQGNLRYVTMNRRRDPGVGPEARGTLTEGQWPYATILSCSDSRVPPELIFDEGLGRLFIVRVAGNILTPELLGSVEYASLHSTSRLIVVLGHQSCGAVAAAVHATGNPDTKHTPAIETIINSLMPAVEKSRRATGLKGEQLVEAAAKENVRRTAQQIANQSQPLAKMQTNGDLQIVGAYYSLATGKVEIWT